jgi:hypothetical protein
MGPTFPRIETRYFPGFVSTVSVGPSNRNLVCNRFGDDCVDGHCIFACLRDDTVQREHHSPRLVVWIARDPVMANALGIFTATFLYALSALSWVDRNRSGIVPIGNLLVVFALLIASVDMFMRLIQRIGLLQINRMLIFKGDRGREVIETTYPLGESEVVAKESVDFNELTCTQTLIHHGQPRSSGCQCDGLGEFGGSVGRNY